MFIGRAWVERPLIERQINMLFSLGVGVQFSSLIVVPLLSRVGRFTIWGRVVVVEMFASRVVVRSIVFELVYPRNDWWERDRDTGDFLP